LHGPASCRDEALDFVLALLELLGCAEGPVFIGR
jgi:hypothetical protein